MFQSKEPLVMPLAIKCYHRFEMPLWLVQDIRPRVDGTIRLRDWKLIPKNKAVRKLKATLEVSLHVIVSSTTIKNKLATRATQLNIILTEENVLVVFEIHLVELTEKKQRKNKYGSFLIA